MSSRRFVWFAPHAGNFVTFRMEHRVANALVDAGHDVLMIQCDSVLDAHCQVMSPAGVPATAPLSERRRVCAECRHDAALGRERGRYRTMQLSELLDDGDYVWADGIVASVTPESWDSIVIDDLPIGRYASYTAILHHKTPSVSSSAEAWAEYTADLRGALLVSRAMRSLTRCEHPTHAMVYNALYPANRVFAEAMTRSGAILLNLSAGPTVPRRYSTLALYDGIKASQTLTDSNAFRASVDVPASELEILHVERHLAHLMSAADPWVYSAAASRRPASQIRSQLGVRADSPVVTVIISSPDETRASLMVDAEFHRDPENGYSDVAEFVRAAIDLSRERPDCDFVFRLHPRLAPNKRERLTSPDLEVLYALLEDLPPNVVINHPSESVSLYDLVLISEAALNQSSSAGLEFLAFGVPVVQYDPVRLGAFPREWAFCVPRHDAAALAGGLDLALASGFDIDRVVKAYRWYASMQIRSVVHLDPLEDLVAPAEVSGAADVKAPEPPRPHPIGRYLPIPVKERIASRMQRRRRSGEIDDAGLDTQTTQVLLSAIDHATNTGDVWEPFLVFPESLSIDDERVAVTEALTRLCGRMDLSDAPAMGVLRAADIIQG